MVEKIFEKLGMPDIERFENYLPTAFNSELTLLQKVNKIIFDLIETNKLTNEMVDYLNKFIETFDFKMETTINDVLDVWLKDGIIENLINEHILVIDNPEIIRVINNDNELENSGSIPSYVKENIISVSSQIPDNNNFKFGLITDDHFERTTYSQQALNHYQYLCETTKYVPLSFILSNGDNVNGNTEKGKVIEDNYNIASIMLSKTTTDSFILKGNHDDGSYYNLTHGNEPSGVITDRELAYIYNARRESDVKRPCDNTYFYKDYEEKQIRVIGLNSYDCPLTTAEGKLKYPTIENSGFSIKQLNWLANEALILPSNSWKVIVFSHAPLNNSFNSFIQYNDTVLLNILKDFMTGDNNYYVGQNSDFSGTVNTNFTSNGNLLMFISGHLHGDGQTFFNGINCIQTRASLPYPKDERIEGTTSEYAYDVFEVSEQDNKVNIYRYGFSDFGVKRTYQLKEVI